MYAKTFAVFAHLDGFEINWINAKDNIARRRFFPNGSRGAYYIRRMLLNNSCDVLVNGGTKLFTAALDPMHPKTITRINGEWIDPEAEQRADEETPVRLTPDPIPDQLITDVSVGDDDIVIMCRAGGEGRPMMHTLHLSDDRVDEVVRLFSDHLFTFELSRGALTLRANELISCPICAGRYTP